MERFIIYIIGNIIERRRISDKLNRKEVKVIQWKNYLNL
jgi:transcription antitermination factor NusA-like protein